MADFFRGLAGGFQTGLQFGNAMQQREERERLREAAGLTPQEMQQRQASPEELARAQAETQALAAEDARMFGLGPQEQAAYAPQMPAEGQRVGLPRYQLAGQTYDRAPTQQEIQQARYGAMADVIAERDPARAMEMRQRLEEQAYQAQRRPLELQSLQGQIAGQAQQRELAGLQLTDAQRKQAQDKANRTAQTMLAELSAAGTPIDTATANRIAKDTGADMTYVTDAVLKQYNLTKASANDLIERQLTDFNEATKGGIPTLNKYIAERLDPDKTDNIVPKVVQGADGKLRVMYGDKPLPGYQAYGDLNQLSAAFQGNIKRDPLSAAIQISTLETQAQARKASESTIRASDSLVGLRNEQVKSIRDVAANATERADIVDKFEALTDEEKAGAKGQGLIKQFNLLNAKAGGQVALGATPKAAGPVKMDDLDKENLRAYRDWEKDSRNAKLPQGEKDKKAMQLGVTQFLNRAGEGPTTGVGSNPYAAPQQGVDTTRAPAPAARPAMRGPSDLSTVDIQRIRNDAAALDAAIAQVQAQASAVVRSGDTAAIKLYGDRLNTLRAQRQALTSGLTGPAIQSVGLQ